MNTLISTERTPYQYRFCYFIALGTSILTIVTFTIAFLTPPISGPFCLENCIDYPYHNIIDRFPRDYIWMYFAIVLTLLFVVFVATINHVASSERKLFGQIGLSFAILAAIPLLLAYFIQLIVIQPSIIRGETEGIAILTQYNPHGLFIALEETGYMLMGLAFFSLVPVFNGKSKLERLIQWIFSGSFLLIISSLVIISILYGPERSYRFEIIVISIDWFVLIISGFLLAGYIRKHRTDKN
jgi:hypothetical protein